MWLYCVFYACLSGFFAVGQDMHPSGNNSIVLIENANMSQEYSYSVNFSTIYMFKYHYHHTALRTGAVRVYVESEDSVSSRPVLVVVRHEKGVLSWQLPLLVQASVGSGKTQAVEQYRSVNRTLCPVDDYDVLKEDENRKYSPDLQYITISVSTSSAYDTGFKLIVYVKEDFKVEMNESREFDVTPSSPQYFQFRFPDETNIAIISMESQDNLCMTMSVQNISCPVSDLDKNVELEGVWQTVDTKTGMTIRRDLFPSGLHIVFVVKPDDRDCTSSSSYLHDNERSIEGVDCHGPCRYKTVKFSISEKITYDEYLTATFGAFFMFLGAYVLVILVSCLICVRKRRAPLERSLFEVPPPEPIGSVLSRSRSRYGSISSCSTISSISGPAPTRKDRVEINHHRKPDEDGSSTSSESSQEIQQANGHVPEATPGSPVHSDHLDHTQEIEVSETVDGVNGDGEDLAGPGGDREQPVGDGDGKEGEESIFDEADYDLLRDADFDKDVFRTKTFLFVSDLARKHPSVLHRKAMMYQWNLLTVSIFYGLPVVQLVVTYQQVLHQTGNEDLCYYNFLCAHPFGLLSDFNHVFSNLGYVMLGGLFMVFVWRRDFIYQGVLEDNPRIARMYGIPQHSGLFYAMGLALVMEGLMSGCYHICPNHSNFQFDTAFMYTIAILCMLKIYQFRHPDINANAYTAFGVLAFVILIGMLGVTNSSIPFWIFFTGCHVITCLIVSIQVYYMGRWKVNAGIFKRIWLMMYNDFSSLFMGAWHALKPTYPDRMILLIIFNLINWGLSGYGIMVMAQNEGDFASFLLGVFIINLLLYTSFYILMKIRYGERICRQPLTYILLASLCWAPAMYFFLNKSTSWNVSAAQSRHFNQSCRLFHFYDNHDIWHFLSAAALFLSFMVLLTIDDDLAEKPRDKIPVF